MWQKKYIWPWPTQMLRITNLKKFCLGKRKNKLCPQSTYSECSRKNTFGHC